MKWQVEPLVGHSHTTIAPSFNRAYQQRSISVEAKHVNNTFACISTPRRSALGEAVQLLDVWQAQQRVHSAWQWLGHGVQCNASPCCGATCQRDLIEWKLTECVWRWWWKVWNPVVIHNKQLWCDISDMERWLAGCQLELMFQLLSQLLALVMMIDVLC